MSYTLSLTFDTGKLLSEEIHVPETVIATTYKELPTTWTRKLWNKLTRKPVPHVVVPGLHSPARTIPAVPHLHTVEIDTDDVNGDALESLIIRMMDDHGYELISAVAEEYGRSWSREDLATQGFSAPDSESLVSLIRGLESGNYPPAAFFAAITEYGWDADTLSDDWMGDHFRGEWDSAADWAEEFVTDCYNLDIPSFVCVDWEGTADELDYDYDFVTYNLMVYVFDKH